MSVITLTGPTCAGKSTIERELQRAGCGRAISHTTRPPRTGEKDGREYHFISDTAYDILATEGEFVEIVELGHRRYAMSKTALKLAQDQALNVAVVVDPHGASQIRKYCEDNDMPVFSVWVDCGVAEQTRRFMQRAILDHQAGTVNVVGTYAERLHMMMVDEAVWRHNAERWIIDEGRKYDKQINSSDKTTPRELAGSILFSVPGYGYKKPALPPKESV